MLKDGFSERPSNSFVSLSSRGFDALIQETHERKSIREMSGTDDDMVEAERVQMTGRMTLFATLHLFSSYQCWSQAVSY